MWLHARFGSCSRVPRHSCFSRRDAPSSAHTVLLRRWHTPHFSSPFYHTAGVMNNFLISTRHPLALLYNNQSVLENHHCATALSLLERPELNFLHRLPREQQQTMVSPALPTPPL